MEYLLYFSLDMNYFIPFLHNKYQKYKQNLFRIEFLAHIYLISDDLFLFPVDLFLFNYTLLIADSFLFHEEHLS